MMERAPRRPAAVSLRHSGALQAASLLAALVALAFTSVFIGVSNISPLDIFHLTPIQAKVLTISRVPRMLSAIMAGSALGIAGMIMQQLTRNKFVSPTTAGTMDAARLGVLVSIILFPAASLLQKTGIALVFALAGTFIFVRIVERVKIKNAIFIPLVGLMFGNIVSAATTSIAYRFDLIQSLSTWLHGDFSMILRGRYEILYIGVPLILIAYMYADRFTIAGLGDTFATNLGLNYRHVVNVGLIIVAAISATVVLTVGSLPFLGLIVPNIVTVYRGDNVKHNLLHTALLGAVFVLACDIVGRIILHPYEVSVGMIMGVVGSGVFLFMLLRRERHG